MISFMNTSWLLLASLTSSLPSPSTSSLTSSKTSSLTSSITPSSSLISLASVLSLSLSCFLLLFQLHESHAREVFFRFGGNCCCFICHLSIWLCYQPIAWEIWQYILFLIWFGCSHCEKGSSGELGNCEKKARVKITRTWSDPRERFTNPLNPPVFYLMSSV